MKHLQRYIAKTVLQVTALVIMVFAGLEVLIMFISQLNNIGSGHYGLWQAFVYIVLSFPGEFYQLFPMAALLGCLLGLGVLASNSEIVVMRAAGFSTSRILGAVLMAVFCLIILVSVLGEVIAPRATLAANQYKTLALSGGKALPTRHGLWLKNKNTFVHINTVVSPVRLEGVTRYTFNPHHELIENSYAKVARFIHKKWWLYDLVASVISRTRVTHFTSKKRQWSIDLHPSLLTTSKVDPHTMTLSELNKTIRYRQSNGLNASSYALILWQRLLKPLAVLVMMLLAVPFVFGPLRNVSLGLRLMSGILLGFAFFLVNQFFGPASMVYQVPPWFAAAAPIGLFAILGFTLVLTKR